MNDKQKMTDTNQQKLLDYRLVAGAHKNVTALNITVSDHPLNMFANHKPIPTKTVR